MYIFQYGVTVVDAGFYLDPWYQLPGSVMCLLVQEPGAIYFPEMTTCLMGIFRKLISCGIQKWDACISLAVGLVSINPLLTPFHEAHFGTALRPIAICGKVTMTFEWESFKIGPPV